MKTLKILLAPDSFKGSLTSGEVCAAFAEGIREAAAVSGVECELRAVPLADGGEGTTKALADACGGQTVDRRVTGPLGDPVEAFYGVIGAAGTQTAVIETAAASGLTLVSRERLDPARASTYGTGELIRAALDAGLRRFIIGLGGSATNDGGLGALQALGARFLDSGGAELGRGGEVMRQVASIDTSHIHPALNEAEFTLACDVTNPFCGPEGAAYVFAPQKGASPATVEALDAGLRHLAGVILAATGRDISEVPGAGAAGGLCGGLLAFTNAHIQPGFEVTAQAVGLDGLTDWCDIAVTGEGHTDMQTAGGKLPAGVAGMARAHGKPAICISGGFDPEAEAALRRVGVTAMFAITPGPTPLEAAITNARALAASAARNALAAVLCGVKL